MTNEMLRFASAHLSPYRIRGDELIPDLCPFCRGGEHADRYTFALNLTDGVYVCKRGQCGARGRFEELAARLRGRGTDAPEVIARRLANSKRELEFWREYKYIIVNDELSVAEEALGALIQSFRLSSARLKEPPFDEC